MALTMPTASLYDSPGAMPPVAVNAFNSLVHSIASQSEASWPIVELFKAKFTGGQSWSSSESWAITGAEAELHKIRHGGSRKVLASDVAAMENDSAARGRVD